MKLILIEKSRYMMETTAQFGNELFREIFFEVCNAVTEKGVPISIKRIWGDLLKPLHYDNHEIEKDAIYNIVHDLVNVMRRYDLLTSDNVSKVALFDVKESTIIFATI